MNIDIEVQYLCLKQEFVRGIPYYIKNLIDNLVVYGNNNYSISLFDYGKERNNIEYIYKYLKNNTIDKVKIHECNDLSYKKFFEGYIADTSKAYDSKSYEEYVNGSFDVVHFPSVLSLPQNVKTKTVVTVHDVIPCLPSFEANWNADIQEVFLKSVDYVRDRRDITVIADSASTKRDLMTVSGIEGSRIYVVPLAIDNNNVYFQEDEATLERMHISGEYILYLGALDPRKGIIDIIKSFTAVKNTYPDIKLVLAGGMEPNYKDRIIDTLNSSAYIDDIILPGYVTDEQKRILLSSAEIFLFPSEYEGFGLPVLEAMTCGTPVITTNVSSLPEVGGDAAVYVSPNNVDELSEAIIRLLDDAVLRDELKQKSIIQSQLFSWEKTVKLTEDVYMSV